MLFVYLNLCIHDWPFHDFFNFDIFDDLYWDLNSNLLINNFLDWDLNFSIDNLFHLYFYLFDNFDLLDNFMVYWSFNDPLNFNDFYNLNWDFNFPNDLFDDHSIDRNFDDFFNFNNLSLNDRLFDNLLNYLSWCLLYPSDFRFVSFSINRFPCQSDRFLQLLSIIDIGYRRLRFSICSLPSRSSDNSMILVQVFVCVCAQDPITRIFTSCVLAGVSSSWLRNMIGCG